MPSLQPLQSGECVDFLLGPHRGLGGGGMCSEQLGALPARKAVIRQISLLAHRHNLLLMKITS